MLKGVMGEWRVVIEEETKEYVILISTVYIYPTKYNFAYTTCRWGLTVIFSLPEG